MYVASRIAEDHAEAMKTCSARGGYVCHQSDFADFCMFSSDFGGSGSFDPFAGFCDGGMHNDAWFGDTNQNNDNFSISNSCSCGQYGGFDNDGGSHHARETHPYRCCSAPSPPVNS